MNKSLNKIIFKTVAITLSSLIGLTLFISLFMYLVFTKNFADFMYGLGCENVASNLYFKVYEKNDDIYYCYKALNLKIGLEKNDDIVKYFKEFESDNEYLDFVKYLKEKNDELSVGNLEKSVLICEDNYLKNCFVKALISTNRADEAFDYSVEAFKDYKNFNLENMGVYTFNNFIDKDYDFYQKYFNYDVNLITAIKSYFDKSYDEYFFDVSKKYTSLQNVYRINLGNRLLMIAKNLKKFYSSDDFNLNLEKDNQKMIKINNVIKGLI